MQQMVLTMRHANINWQTFFLTRHWHFHASQDAESALSTVRELGRLHKVDMLEKVVPDTAVDIG